MTPHDGGASIGSGTSPGGRNVNPFLALRHRNFRLFFFGQLISFAGTWMQRIAQAWLVLQLTNSPFLLGLVGALQWTPMLLLSLVGGVVADRVNKRDLIVATQTLQMLQAFALGALVLSGHAQYWHILVFATALGVTAAFDNPARQAFLFDMVEGTDTMNAVALNSTIVNSARLFGPAIAGIATGTLGIGYAFVANGVSFIPVIGALLMMRLEPARRVDVGSGMVDHLRDGLAYLFRTPTALQLLTLLGVYSIFVMNFNIIVPVFAKNVLHEDATGFGLLTSAQGAGAVLGALAIASMSSYGPHPGLVYGGAALLGVMVIVLGSVHQFTPAALVLAGCGISMVVFSATVNTALQVTTPDALRGRVMSVYSLVNGGFTPAGAIFTGGVAEVWGAPAELAISGLIALGSTLAVYRWHRRLPWTVEDAPAALASADPSPADGSGGER